MGPPGGVPSARKKLRREAGAGKRRVRESVEGVMQILENDGLLALGQAVRCRAMTWVRFAPAVHHSTP